jgi:DNA helicase-2/ATP-dependent DNA helicase PcrA
VAAYSRVVNARPRWASVLRAVVPVDQEHEAAIAQVFERVHPIRKRDHGLLDFDDLLLYWRAAAADPVTGPALAAAYDHVLVDEYQDTNLIQADIVQISAPRRWVLTHGGRRRRPGHLCLQGRHGAQHARLLHSVPGCDGRSPSSATTARPSPSWIWPTPCSPKPRRGTTSGCGPTRREVDPGPVLATCPDEGGPSGRGRRRDPGALRVRRRVAAAGGAVPHCPSQRPARGRAAPPGHPVSSSTGVCGFSRRPTCATCWPRCRVLDNPRDELAWYRLLQLLDGIGPAGARTLMADLGVTDLGSPHRVANQDPLGLFVGGGCPLPPKAAADGAGAAAALGRLPGRHAPAWRPDRPTAPGSRSAAPAPVRQRRGPPSRPRSPEPAGGRLRHRARAVAELTLDPPSSTGDLAGPPLLDDDYVILSARCTRPRAASGESCT